jgi:hypothetical protein
MQMQITEHIMMIRPVRFGFNTETAESNVFQQTNYLPSEQLQQKALAEFDNMVTLLQTAGVNAIVIEDTTIPHTPDSIFPNNWISFHTNGEVILYPMQAPNRRQEKRKDVIELLKKKGFGIHSVTDFSDYEKEGKFLEGTGSMVLDRDHKIAYACISPRTHPDLLEKFSQHTGYQIISFYAEDQDRIPIYHTNVLMSVGENFSTVCSAAIPDRMEREKVINSLRETGKAIIDLSFDQLYHFAGNMLAVENSKKEKLVVLSNQAYQSLSAAQLEQLSLHGKVLHPSLDIIETTGGGSARCMMAEIFLPYSS